MKSDTYACRYFNFGMVDLFQTQMPISLVILVIGTSIYTTFVHDQVQVYY